MSDGSTSPIHATTPGRQTIIDDKAPPSSDSSDPPNGPGTASAPPAGHQRTDRFDWPTRENVEAASDDDDVREAVTPAGPVTDYADTQAAASAAEVERIVETLGTQAGAAAAAAAAPAATTPPAATAASTATASSAATASPTATAPPTAASPPAASPPASTASVAAATFSDSGPAEARDADLTTASPIAPAAPLVEARDASAMDTRDSGELQPGLPPPEGAEPTLPALPAYLHRSDTGWSVFKRIVAAKTRQLGARLSRHITDRTLRIGISARIFHPQPGGKGLQSKTLQYLEESIAHWVMTRNALVFMVPTVNQEGAIHPSDIRMRDYARTLDGLVLQGGADVSPMSYSESATRPEWIGDRVRDLYELELLQAFIDAGKPVLGICRGCQLINVAFGGTLHQDIANEIPTAIPHVNDRYDANWHPIVFPEGSTFPSLFDGLQGGMVNSIHHQSVKRLGRDLSIEAVSPDDDIVEAIRLRRAPFVVGLQWHPEFHGADTTSSLLNCTPILDQFLRAARETRF
ncbi:MAG: type 1 glutamine amidotransferase [Burkholderiaceae bacterium]